MNADYPTVWVLADDKAGHANQALGVAEALGWPFEVKHIIYQTDAKKANLLKGVSLKGIDLEATDKLEPPWPDIVIAAGRKTAPIARWIKKQSRKKTFLCQLMWPGVPAHDFNLIAIPEHDAAKLGKNIIRTLGAPSRVSPELLKTEAEIWHKTLEHLPKPRIALLVGGNTDKIVYLPQHSRELGILASQVTKAANGSLLVTMSRRTTSDFRLSLQNAIECQVYYDPENERSNPYYAFLALADLIIVTGDSISMCSEACAAAKPLAIFAPPDIIPDKHKRMHQSVYKLGRAKPFTQDNLTLFSKVLSSPTSKISPLNPSLKIAEVIKEKCYSQKN